jgi:hypothetical protein
MNLPNKSEALIKGRTDQKIESKAHPTQQWMTKDYNKKEINY